MHPLLPAWSSGSLPLSVPVEPDADTAREWAEDELSRSVYQESTSFFDMILTWLAELWDYLSSLGTGVSAPIVPIIVAVILAGVVAISLVLAGRVQSRGHRGSGDSRELFEDSRDSAALFAAADAAAASGNWPVAVLEHFRAIIRSLDERTIVEDRAGLTAHEAATEASAAMPPHSSELTWAAVLFDDVAYGEAVPGSEEYARLQQLAAGVREAKPVPPGQRGTPTSAGWARAR